MSHVDLVLADLRQGLAKRADRRAKSARVATLSVLLLVSGAAAGQLADRPVPTETVTSASVLGLSGCERDAFGCSVVVRSRN
jgi:hypothetical protein